MTDSPLIDFWETRTPSGVILIRSKRRRIVFRNNPNGPGLLMSETVIERLEYSGRDIHAAARRRRALVRELESRR